ncbi:MAG: hypothetical protein K9K63_18585 [Desulfotignum sp.]|nr:hypothetical protein [Desulfotignum sp.]MCF8139309.1 hypothetical protein [Desulfotignum sp.]
MAEKRGWPEPMVWSLVLDPMAEGVTPALPWAAGAGPVSAKGKPDLVIFDPPYFNKKAGEYRGGFIAFTQGTDIVKGSPDKFFEA